MSYIVTIKNFDCMKLFFLTYDLRNNRDYKALYDELNKLNAVRILESTWCFKLQDTVTAETVRNHFQNYIDKDDAVIASQVNEWASFNTDGHPNQL